MGKIKVIPALLLICLTCTASEIERGENRTDKSAKQEHLPDKLVLQKSQPYTKEEPSLLSKVSNWFFSSNVPERRDDQIGEEGGFSGPQYLPPSQSYNNDIKCHPCNQSPWVPIASPAGHNTLISFVPRQPHSGFFNQPSPPHQGPPLDFRQPQFAPTQFYGPPKPQYGPPKPQYGPPIPQYGPPKPQYGPPKPLYGPPSQFASHSMPIKDYMVPPPALQSGRHSGHKYTNTLAFFRPLPTTQLRGVPSTKMVPPPLHFNHRRPPHPNSLITHLKPIRNKHPSPYYLDVSGIEGIVPPPPPELDVGQSAGVDFPPPEQLPSSTGDNQYDESQRLVPLPLPNLSGLPVPPIRPANNFRQEFQQPVQLLPSVKVADYLSTVEHPINVVQSPLVELNVKDEVLEDSSHKESQHQISQAPYDYSPTSSGPSNFGGGNDEIPDTSGPHYPTGIGHSHNTEISYPQFNNHNYDNSNNVFEPKGAYEGAESKLSHNPIVVDDDNHAAASTNFNKTVTNTQKVEDTTTLPSALDNIVHPAVLNNLLRQHGLGHLELNSTQNLDFSKWAPYFGVGVLTKMAPPPVRPTWLLPLPAPQVTTKKPMQIIIPYITNKQPIPFVSETTEKSVIKLKPTNSYTPGLYTTLVPVYTPPPATQESIWMKFVDDFNLAQSNKKPATAFTRTTTQVYNIRDLLKDTKAEVNTGKLPYDIISLQKNINDWTQQEFSNNLVRADHLQLPKASTTSRFAYSKKIPNEYLTTPSYEYITTGRPIRSQIFDNVAAGSNKKERLQKDLETNFVLSDKTTEKYLTSTSIYENGVRISTKSTFPLPFSNKGDGRSKWEVSHITTSPITKEKIYVVTPAPEPEVTTKIIGWSAPPKVHNGGKEGNVPKFLIKVEPEEGKKTEAKKEKKASSGLKVVFSEWPHKINNLQTTTTPKATSRHPLFGLMDIPAYSVPANGTVQTLTGHSKVVATTPGSVIKKNTSPHDKKVSNGNKTDSKSEKT